MKLVKFAIAAYGLYCTAYGASQIGVQSYIAIKAIKDKRIAYRTQKYKLEAWKRQLVHQLESVDKSVLKTHTIIDSIEVLQKDPNEIHHTEIQEWIDKADYLIDQIKEQKLDAELAKYAE